MDGDSWDWIANGLFLAGQDVRYSGRAPLLPLAIALLERLSALPWLPVLLQLHWPADSPALARGREKAEAIRSWIGGHDGGGRPPW